MIRLRTITRSPVARKIRRYRRPLAAALAGLSVLLIVAGLRPSPVNESPADPIVQLAADQVAVPVALANPAITSAIRIGDVVDVIALSDGGDQTIARDVTVIDIVDAGLVMLAAEARQGSALAAAALERQITVTIHPSNPDAQ